MQFLIYNDKKNSIMQILFHTFNVFLEKLHPHDTVILYFEFEKQNSLILFRVNVDY